MESSYFGGEPLSQKLLVVLLVFLVMLAVIALAIFRYYKKNKTNLALLAGGVLLLLPMVLLLFNAMKAGFTMVLTLFLLSIVYLLFGKRLPY